MTASPERFSLEVGDTVVRGRVAGSGQPLVLVHGWTLDQRVFNFQFEPLSRHFRVISYDRRGCGLSDAAPDIAADVDDLDAIIRQVAGEPAHLLGMSQGGRIALRYAVAHGENLRSMVLQGPALDQFEAEEAPGEEVPMTSFAALAAAGHMAEMHRDWLAHPMMSAGVVGDEARALLREVVGDYRGLDLQQPGGANPEYDGDMGAALRAVAIPTLVITGALETQARRAHAARILSLLPDSKELVLPASGHLSNLGEIEAYNAAVLAFCGRC